MVRALEMHDIRKAFRNVRALNGVDLHVDQGEVLALVGENGAGKSTLMKILSGAYTADAGDMVIDGELVDHATPRGMIERGVAVIYQELSLAPHLSIAENIFLGRLPRRLWRVDWRKLHYDARRVCDQVGLPLDIRSKVGNLSVAHQQMVEIAKALARDARIIVLDEPSAVLGDVELERLFAVIRRLAAGGVAFIYISHRLAEVFEIADRATVLRDGELVGTRGVAELDIDTLVAMMVGRTLADIYPVRHARPGDEVLRVTGLTRSGVLRDVSFSVHSGEIVGVAGLAGAGRTETLRAIVGADPIDGGSVDVHGRRVVSRHPRDAIRRGIGLLPEDRTHQGLFLDQSVTHNITLSKLGDVRRGGLLSARAERRRAVDLIHQLRIRTPGPATRVRNLSGGNQQKVVFAKWLHADIGVLLVDEPTRGVDVGAKQEIYRLLADLADRGAAVVMVSSELPEVLGLSDRIIVMHEGRVAGELSREQATEETIMRLATGQRVA